MITTGTWSHEAAARFPWQLNFSFRNISMYPLSASLSHTHIHLVWMFSKISWTNSLVMWATWTDSSKTAGVISRLIYLVFVALESPSMCYGENMLLKIPHQNCSAGHPDCICNCPPCLKTCRGLRHGWTAGSWVTYFRWKMNSHYVRYCCLQW